MGEKGPIPAHSDQKVRRNLPDTPITKIPFVGDVAAPELGIKNPHPIVSDLYESMKTSAQATYYQPSDWQYARLTMHLLNDMIKPRRNKDGTYTRVSAMMVASINQMLTSLLLTEGDRRRVRIEVERQEADGVVVDVAALFAERMKAGQQQLG